MSGNRHAVSPQSSLVEVQKCQKQMVDVESGTKCLGHRGRSRLGCSHRSFSLQVVVVERVVGVVVIAVVVVVPWS